jgi:membrane protein CcdC involved in cytochrome C biogenesis
MPSLQQQTRQADCEGFDAKKINIPPVFISCSASYHHCRLFHLADSDFLCLLFF